MRNYSEKHIAGQCFQLLGNTVRVCDRERGMPPLKYLALFPGEAGGGIPVKAHSWECGVKRGWWFSRTFKSKIEARRFFERLPGVEVGTPEYRLWVERASGRPR